MNGYVVFGFKGSVLMNILLCGKGAQVFARDGINGEFARMVGVEWRWR